MIDIYPEKLTQLIPLQRVRCNERDHAYNKISFSWHLKN